MKECRSCGSFMPVEEFYRHKAMADGCLNHCKKCVRIRVRKHREANVTDIRAYDRGRGNIPHRIASRVAYRKTPGGLERLNAGAKAWAARNPEKRAAHIIVGNALRYGKLTRLPCAICSTPDTQAHHDDYSRPLNVTWLCVPCHGERHKAASNG
jgi:hypothetical protein